MKKIKLIIIFSIIFLSSANAQFVIDGQFRSRFEDRYGYKKLPAETQTPALFINQRSRINLTLNDEKYQVKFSLQDVHVWGQEDSYTAGGVWGDSKTLDVHEAWGKILLNNQNSLKIGRQVLKYDNQIIFSDRDWIQSAMTYDALLYSFNNEKWLFEVGMTLNNSSENLFGNDYYTDQNRVKTMDFIYLKRMFNKNNHVSFINILTGYQNPDTAIENFYMGTSGINFNVGNDALSLYGGGYYQFGKNNKNKNVQAYMFHSKLTYRAVPKKLDVSAMYKYFSGHDILNEDANYQKTSHVFNIMYGARIKNFGFLNQFLMVGQPMDNAGLQQLAAKIKWKFHKKNTLLVNFYSYSMTANYLNAAGKTLDKKLFHEVDIIWNYKLNDAIAFKTGFMYGLASESMEALKGVSDSKNPYYGWIQIDITPEFFSSNK